MSRRASREARLVRGLIVAAAGSGLAIAGHVVAGGAVPAQPSVLLLIALAAAACTLLSDHEWSAPRLLVALGSIELLVHLGMRLGHSHAAGGLSATAASATASGWLMLLGHVVAALLTAWLLRHGEQTYWLAVDRLRRRPLPRPVPLRVAAPPVVRTSDPAGLRFLRCLLATVSRRGPPARLA